MVQYVTIMKFCWAFLLDETIPRWLLMLKFDNCLVLPMVEGLSVMEVKTNSAYIHWKKPNLKKFQTQEMKYHVCT